MDKIYKMLLLYGIILVIIYYINNISYTKVIIKDQNEK